MHAVTIAEALILQPNWILMNIAYVAIGMSCRLLFYKALWMFYVGTAYVHVDQYTDPCIYRPANSEHVEDIAIQIQAPFISCNCIFSSCYRTA